MAAEDGLGKLAAQPQSSIISLVMASMWQMGWGREGS